MARRLVEAGVETPRSRVVTTAEENNATALVQTFAQGRLFELVHADEAAEVAPVVSFALTAFDALGVRFGAAHVEVMWDGTAPPASRSAPVSSGSFAPRCAGQSSARTSSSD